MDGEFEDESIETLDQNVRKIINQKVQNQSRGYLSGIKNGNAIERRKSKRHCSFRRQDTKKRSLLNLQPDRARPEEYKAKRPAAGQTNGHAASPSDLNELLERTCLDF